MFGAYAQVLRQPGAWKFTAAGAFARMQMSMAGVGAVLLVVAVRDSYGLGGAVSALYAVAAALIGPAISRYIDSFGQRKIVPLQLALHLPAMAAMILLAVYTPATWPILVLALVAGGSQPSVGPLVRARWSTMLSGTPLLRTAFAWESMIDEAVFILGPVLATILALQLFPAAALVVATIFLTIGLFFLLRQVGTEPPSAGVRHTRGGRPAIALPGVVAVFTIFVLVGGVFGALEVTTLAVSKAAGHPEAAGWMLACYSLGSLLSGLVFGALRLRASLLRQFMVVLTLLAVVSLPLIFLVPLWQVTIGLFVAGLAVAPVLISGMAFIEQVVPTARLTESMTWVTSGIALGLAISMPTAGYIADHQPHNAYFVLSGCALAALVAAVLMLPSMRRAQAALTANVVGRDEPVTC